MKETAVVYHGNCPDGFGAAFAAWLVLGDGADYLPHRHGDDWPDLAGRNRVYFLDLCPRAPQLLDLTTRGAAVVVLDHHKASAGDFAAVQGRVGGTHDVTRSGAVLAWEHFHPGAPCPPLLLYVQDRDLWRWELPHSREISAWLSLQPKEFAVWDRLSVELRSDPHFPSGTVLTWRGAMAVREGKIVLACHQKIVDRLVRDATETVVAGHKVPCVNTPVFQSEVGEVLARGQPFAVCWYESGGKVRYSLRSDKGGLDVSVIAGGYGGGGHRHAAGYEVSVA